MSLDNLKLAVACEAVLRQMIFRPIDAIGAVEDLSNDREEDGRVALPELGQRRPDIFKTILLQGNKFGAVFGYLDGKDVVMKLHSA